MKCLNLFLFLNLEILIKTSSEAKWTKNIRNIRIYEQPLPHCGHRNDCYPPPRRPGCHYQAREIRSKRCICTYLVCDRNKLTFGIKAADDLNSYKLSINKLPENSVNFRNPPKPKPSQNKDHRYPTLKDTEKNNGITFTDESSNGTNSPPIISFNNDPVFNERDQFKPPIFSPEQRSKKIEKILNARSSEFEDEYPQSPIQSRQNQVLQNRRKNQLLQKYLGSRRIPRTQRLRQNLFPNRWNGKARNYFVRNIPEKLEFRSQEKSGEYHLGEDLSKGRYNLGRYILASEENLREIQSLSNIKNRKNIQAQVQHSPTRHGPARLANLRSLESQPESSEASNIPVKKEKQTPVSVIAFDNPKSNEPSRRSSLYSLRRNDDSGDFQLKVINSKDIVQKLKEVLHENKTLFVHSPDNKKFEDKFSAEMDYKDSNRLQVSSEILFQPFPKSQSNFHTSPTYIQQLANKTSITKPFAIHRSSSEIQKNSFLRTSVPTNIQHSYPTYVHHLPVIDKSNEIRAQSLNLLGRLRSKKRRNINASYSHTQVCKDKHPNCSFWSRHGECFVNSGYMAAQCCRSCTSNNQAHHGTGCRNNLRLCFLVRTQRPVTSHRGIEKRY